MGVCASADPKLAMPSSIRLEQRRGQNTNNPVGPDFVADCVEPPPAPLFSLDLAIPIASAADTKSSYGKSSYGMEGLVINTSGVQIAGADAAFAPIDPACLSIDRSRTLGSGACATVLFARSRVDGRALAIKPVSVNDKTNRSQLLKEVRSLYTSDCECVVNFFGAYFEKGNICMVLEYMDLGGLNSAFAGQRLPPRVLACVVHQMIFGLAYLYRERTMHRDIKPANVLVNSEGQVKLTDLGISKTLDATIGAASTFVGTMQYMSPERLTNKGYDSRADVWSLGLITIELATGVFPIRADVRNQLEFMMAVRSFEGPPLSVDSHGASHGVTQHFVDFCAAMTATDVARRPLAEGEFILLPLHLTRILLTVLTRSPEHLYQRPPRGSALRAPVARRAARRRLQQ